MYQRSTKGASKQRRDLINVEINEIKDLLPVNESTRKRLSQLQVMALCNSYINKANCFQNSIFNVEWDQSTEFSKFFDFSEALPGFIITITLDGKLLYISENVTEYLGHSMVELMTQADSVYDLIDRTDHHVIREFLQSSKVVKCDNVKVRSSDELDFMCRMNLGQLFRRNNVFDRQKVMKIHGKVVWPQGSLTLTEPIFVGRVTPVLGCLSSEQLSAVPDTMMFYTIHSMDLKFISIENNGEFHLGYNQEELVNKSWYQLTHPDNTAELSDKHMQLVQKGLDTSKSLVMKVQTKSGQFVWMHVLMRFASLPYASLGSESLAQEIICVNHIIDEQQAFDTINHLKMEERFCTGMQRVFDPSLVAHRETCVPTVVIEEDLMEEMMSEDKRVNCNHEELMQRIREKAQWKQNKKFKVSDIASPTGYIKYDDYTLGQRNSLVNQGYLVNSLHGGFGGKKCMADMKKDFKNDYHGGLSPFTPSSVEDNSNGLDCASLTYTAPTPELIKYTPYTPPYSPSGSSYMEESTSITGHQDDVSLFEGSLPGAKKQETLKRKREESLSDDLPELDHCLVEHILQGVECLNPSNISLLPSSVNISAPPQRFHNVAVNNSGFLSAAQFQQMQANQKYIRSGAVKSVPHQGNMCDSLSGGLVDFLYGEEAGLMDLMRASDLFESLESPCTGLALHSF